jgi:hypothetical protein
MKLPQGFLKVEVFVLLLRSHAHVAPRSQEILVDATEDVTRDILQLFRIKRAQKLAEDLIIQLLILALGQNAAQAL